MTIIELNERQYMDCINLADGLFAPLSNFLTEKEVISVLTKMKLPTGEVWIHPLTLDIESSLASQIEAGTTICLSFSGNIFGSLLISEIYEINIDFLVQNLFGTTCNMHPGVALERSKSPMRVAGKITVDDSCFLKIVRCSDIRRRIRSSKTKTFVGFQTRNPPHRAHEYLQRTALEVFDGLLLNPLVGWKKSGDFSEAAVNAGYDAMMQSYYRDKNVIFAPLKTTMLYAGPREAIHHALMRRNMGCTHFIVGRDHAGVGDYYSIFAAHDLIHSLLAQDYDFGIEFLLFREPTFCHKCEHVVTDKICGHDSDLDHESISGSKIRQYFVQNKVPPRHFMRNEVIEALKNLTKPLFVEKE